MDRPADDPYMIWAGHEGLYYTDFMPRLCATRGAKTYLEVGVASGGLFEKIACDIAIAVDPAFALNCNVLRNKGQAHFYQLSSDRFFSEVDARGVFGGSPDIVFLDGLHHFDVLLRDFINAERICGANSLIIMHDCFPLTLEMTDRDNARAVARAQGRPYHTFWTGDVWKIIPILREHRPDLKLVCLDAAPTGLLCVTNLDPESTTLRARYDQIVDTYAQVPEAEAANLYATITLEPAAAALLEADHAPPPAPSA